VASAFFAFSAAAAKFLSVLLVAHQAGDLSEVAGLFAAVLPWRGCMSRVHDGEISDVMI